MAITKINQVPLAERPLALPFTFFVDSAEQEPFCFKGMKADSKGSYRPYAIDHKNAKHYQFRSLGRHPNSFGDYSIGWEFNGVSFSGIGKVAVERKSITDLQGTVLGYSDNRRERFESELANLSKITACVVVECSFLRAVTEIEPRSGRKVEHLQKNLFNSLVSLIQHHQVPFMFFENRRLAEKFTFRYLEMYHRHWMQRAKRGDVVT